MNKIIRKLYSAIIAGTCSLIIPVGLVMLMYFTKILWSDSNSVYLFVLWSIPYSLVVGSMSLPAQALNAGGQNKIGLAVIGALLASSVWSLNAAIYYSGLHLDSLLLLFIIFIIPIQIPWFLGGVGGLLIVLDIQARTRTADLHPSMRNRTVKSILFATLPLLCVFGFFFAWFAFIKIGSYTDYQPEIYLIPKGYVGPGIVIFDGLDGVDGKYEGSSRVFEVPPSGVLFTKLSEPNFSFRDEFWYVDLNGRRTRIPYYGYCDKAIPDDPVIACEPPVETRIQGRPAEFHTSFIIGKPSQYQENLDALFRLAQLALMPQR